VTELKGKIAWVTGAGSGIGEAAARLLAADGMTVVLSGRRKAALEEVAARIKQAGGKAVVRPADVMRADAVRNVAESIKAEFGRLDVLVNNAGLNIPDRTWQRLKPDGIDQVIGANLTGAFYVVQAAANQMKAQADVQRLTVRVDKPRSLT